MRLIVTKTIEKLAEEAWLNFDQLYDFIKDNWDHWFLKLCSPMPDTIAYKGYYDRLRRVIVFVVSKHWIIYPVYVWDKNDSIAKNITVEVIRKNAIKWYNTIKLDAKEWNVKVRHF